LNIGERVLSFSSIASTNAFALDNHERLVSGTVIWSLEQTAGYGRLRRRWESAQGGLWFSVVFKSILQRNSGAYVKLLSCAVIRVLEHLDIPVLIKWPNDFLIQGRKLGGVLAESVLTSGRAEVVVVGVGINVNNDLPDGLRTDGITLKEYSGRSYELPRLLQMFLRQSDNLRKNYLSPERLRYLTRLWKSKLSTAVGDSVVVQMPDRTVRGIVRRINADSVELDCGGQPTTVRNGDLFLQPR